MSAARVLLGVGGGIAAYKAADLVRRLREHGAQVRVALTENAARFVTPVTFQALSGEPARTSLWDEAAEAAMGHIELARWATHVLIAPATADLIARLAHGHADDLITTLALATEAPLTLAPAMNRVMWSHPATAANVALLKSRGVAFLGPDAGGQACGETGEGRMMEPAAIAEALLDGGAAEPKLLSGRRVMVTAGPTFEDLDPVRYLGNRSSGRMGFAIAEQAQRMGAQVVLIAGPVNLPTPAGVSRIDVRSAQQMYEAVIANVAGQDVYVGTAAVADFRPSRVATDKIKKEGDGGLTLELVQNPDILAQVAALPQRPFVVGFAAETTQVERHARDKLQRKNLDLIAANRVGLEGCGFDAERNALSVYWRDGGQEIPEAGKPEVARRVLEIVAARIGAAS